MNSEPPTNAQVVALVDDRSSCRGGLQGFTLLELLVAIAIFAVLAAMAYAGLNSVLSTSHHAARQVERLAKVQIAVATISRDFTQLAMRTIRDEYGDPQPAFLASGLRGNKGIEFTRGGRRNPGGFIRSSLQRIGYIVQDNQLFRVSWQVLDRAQDSNSISIPIIDRVNGLILRFMDIAEAWHDQWPPENTINSATVSANPTIAAMIQALPKAVEIILDLQDLGRVTRLYPIYPAFHTSALTTQGQQNPAPQNPAR
ncbi:general secretion pathway protein J [Gammaproteobacteria bacterium]